LSEKQAQFFAYVLESANGTFYVGHTEDLDRRVGEHNDRETPTHKFTPKNGPWTLVWCEPHPTRASAMQREAQIKRMKSARWIREHLLDR
jgi:predicted GIY-YIG superfamily endonuclease